MAQLALLSYAGVVLASWLLVVITYRLFVHPLAKIPGPKIAAASRLYEWYSDCIQPGTYVWKIRDWHERYGEEPPGHRDHNGTDLLFLKVPSLGLAPTKCTSATQTGMTCSTVQAQSMTRMPGSTG